MQGSERARSPRFGERLRGVSASESNPHREGFYVRTVRRTGRMNPGVWYELTDGRGEFWQYRAADTVFVAGPASERARALEQALEEVGRFYWAVERYNHEPFREAMAKLRAALAVNPPPSGASPQAETSRCAETCGLLRCRLNEGHSGLHQVYNAATGDFQQFIGHPAPVSPVEPEPPTEAQFGEYERLKRQAREIEKALREAGCPAMPLEQGVRWLADKDFTAPLPPRPPAVVKPHRYDLVRYGVTWEGQSNQPLLTPMPDGYWTPWHLAVEAPTVEPEPCVWRDISTAPKVHPLQGGSDLLLAWVAPGIGEWVVVVGCWRDGWWSGSDEAYPTLWAPVPRLPGAPLKVER